MNSKQLSIGLGVVVAVLLAVVGYMALRGNSQNDTLSQQNTTPNSNLVDNNTNTTQPLNTNNQKPANNATPTPTDETATWKTYKNTNYGYEVKYPSEWKITSAHQSIISFGDTFTIGTECIDGRGFPEDAVSQSKKVTYNGRVFIINKVYVQDGKKLFEYTATTEFPTNYRASNPSSELPADYYQTACKVVGFYVNVNKNVTDSLIEQILSTFKFTK